MPSNMHLQIEKLKKKKLEVFVLRLILTVCTVALSVKVESRSLCSMFACSDLRLF